MDADDSEVQHTLPGNRYLPYCFDRERVVEEQVEEGGGAGAEDKERKESSGNGLWRHFGCFPASNRTP